jgi:hypothetical protein
MTRATNYGIQGTTVSIRAGALAVGDAARATSSPWRPNDRHELNEALQRLRAAIDGLALDPATRVAVKDDVTRLAQVVDAPRVERDRVGLSLAGIAARLSSAGVVVTQVAALAEPLAKIAALVRLSMQALGA